jgi:hypothetical protein
VPDYNERIGSIAAKNTGKISMEKTEKEKDETENKADGSVNPRSSGKKKHPAGFVGNFLAHNRKSAEKKERKGRDGPSGQQLGNPRSDRNPRTGSWSPLIQEDPLNVQRMILNHLTLSSRAPITSVYDLATLITDCCANVFDQYHIPDEFQFLDFFEHSIGAVVRPVSSFQNLC